MFALELVQLGELAARGAVIHVHKVGHARVRQCVVVVGVDVLMVHDFQVVR